MQLQNQLQVIINHIEQVRHTTEVQAQEVLQEATVLRLQLNQATVHQVRQEVVEVVLAEVVEVVLAEVADHLTQEEVQEDHVLQEVRVVRVVREDQDLAVVVHVPEEEEDNIR